jgi:4-amino-4-deoxy-L-arabinose transferase-like glycosyltransferase
MLPRLNHRAGHYALLLTAGAWLFLVNLGGPALWDIDEGRNATAALEMRESGDWIKPTFNGQLRSHKPALLYWLQAAAYEWFGVNEFAARLPSALAALATLLLVYELGRRMFNAATGLCGGLVLGSSALFCASAHFANPDALLVAFTAATLLLSWLGLEKGHVHRRWLLLAGPAAGCAVLAKGPVGVALPLAVVGVYLLWSGGWRLLRHRVWWQMSLLCGVVALPWYILVTVETRREFLADFLLTHNLDRALSPMEDHRGPPYYYLVVLLFGLMPWSVFLGSAAWYGAWSALWSPWRRLRGAWESARDAEAGEPQRVDAYRFLWCWVAVYLVLFSAAATKLPNYILPVYPPCALLVARFLDRWRRGALQVPRWLQPTSAALLVLVGAGTVAGLLVAGGAVAVPGLRTWPGLDTWAALGLAPLIGGVAAAWCLRQGRRAAFVGVVAAAALTFIGGLAAGGSTALNSYRAPRPLVQEAQALRRAEEVRVGCYQLEHLPSLNFYVQRHVKYHENEQEVVTFLDSPHRCYLFLPREDWQRLEGQIRVPYRVLASHREMYRSGEVVVVTNR